MGNELLIAICATIIALAAVIVTVWQGILMRRHNRLSVIPHFRFVRQRMTIPKVSYLLKNCGIGPGIIVSVQLKVDGKIFPELGNTMFRGALKLIDIEYKYSTIFEFDPNEVISAGEEIELLDITYPENNPIMFESLNKGIARLGILIHYKSIYGDKFVIEYTPQIYSAV